MEIVLKEIPKSPVVIEGFPGFGLVGTITTEFLIDHLKCKLIGEFIYKELPATVAVHKSALVHPMAVFYNSKYNLVILHTILNVKGQEWKIADAIIDMCKKMKVKELICIEGVGSVTGEEDTRLYSYNNPRLAKLGAKPIEESIIVGVTGAMMLRYPKVSCLFAGTHSQLPDSKAAASVIQMLDKYLGLQVNSEPLLKQAAQFETKVKSIIQKSSATSDDAEKRSMSYLG